MATRNRKKFLSDLANSGKSKKKVVNEDLEKMLSNMMTDASAVNSKISFEEKIALAKVAIQLESVRNRLDGEDWGAGFGTMDDTPAEETDGLQ